MATFTVFSADDSGPGSLRQAVADPNARPGADEIAFDAAIFDAGEEDLIRLTTGRIEITDDLSIRGGPAGVTITGDANGGDVTLPGGITDVAASLAGEDRLDDNSRVLSSTANVTLAGLTLTGGRSTERFESGGAAVLALGDVSLSGVTVAGNSIDGGSKRLMPKGGGINTSGDLTLTDSTVSGNSVNGGYGADGMECAPAAGRIGRA
jgi:hypothetical protein